MQAHVHDVAGDQARDLSLQRPDRLSLRAGLLERAFERGYALIRSLLEDSHNPVDESHHDRSQPLLTGPDLRLFDHAPRAPQGVKQRHGGRHAGHLASATVGVCGTRVKLFCDPRAFRNRLDDRIALVLLYDPLRLWDLMPADDGEPVGMGADCLVLCESELDQLTATGAPAFADE